MQDDITADTLLQLNTQKQTIRDGAEQGFQKIPMPEVRAKASQQFIEQQDDFSRTIIDAFTSSLHRIFMVSAALMALGLILVSFVRERQLRGDVKATPAD